MVDGWSKEFAARGLELEISHRWNWLLFSLYAGEPVLVGVHCHEFHAPVRWGWREFLMTEDAGAETLWSGPREAWRSARASIMARRALLRAVAAAVPWFVVLRATLERVRRLTATTVRRIINIRLTTRAKPRGWRFFRFGGVG